MGEYVHPRLIDWELAMGESKHHHDQKHRKDGPAQIRHTVAAVLEPVANADADDKQDCEKPDQRASIQSLVCSNGHDDAYNP